MDKILKEIFDKMDEILDNKSYKRNQKLNFLKAILIYLLLIIPNYKERR